MFSGIVETTARVAAIREEGGNRHFTLECPFTDELKIDQSIAHNGVCLTVVSIEGDRYTTTAIRETQYDGAMGHTSFDENGQTKLPVELELRTVKNGAWTTR